MRRRQLPAASLHVLLALLEGEKHGYAIMRDVESISDGAVKMGPGTLYGTIGRLVGDGLIEEVAGPSDVDPGAERRRYYRLTQDGTRVASEELHRLQTLLHRVAQLRPRFGDAS
jgi:DNA-binding PadR family transcriptional regulator